MKNLFIFPYMSALSQIVVVLVIFYCRKDLVIEMKILAAYFIVGVGFDAVLIYLARNRIDNLWISQFFSPIQFTMLMMVFYFWNRKSNIGKVIIYAIPTFAVAWCVGSLVSNDLAVFQTFMDPISGLILIFVSSYTLLRIERQEGMSVMELTAFWVSAATIVYFGATVVWSSLNVALLKASLLTKQLAWSTQSIATILANLLYSGGFLCLRRKT